MTDDKILEIADHVYRKFESQPKPGYVRAARLEFARRIEAEVLAGVIQRELNEALERDPDQ